MRISLARVLGDEAVVGDDRRLGEAIEPDRCFPEQPDRPRVSLGRLREPALPEIDRRDDVPPLAVARLVAQAGLDHGDEVGLRGLFHRHAARFDERVRWQSRRAERQIRGDADEGHESGNDIADNCTGGARGFPLAARVAVGFSRTFEQPARNLGPRALSFRACDEASLLIRLDFLQLVAIDGQVRRSRRQVVSGARKERPQQRHEDSRGQKYEPDPNQQGLITERKGPAGGN